MRQDGSEKQTAIFFSLIPTGNRHSNMNSLQFSTCSPASAFQPALVQHAAGSAAAAPARAQCGIRVFADGVRCIRM